MRDARGRAARGALTRAAAAARNYIGAAQALDASKGVMDYLGVLVSRLNARVFVEALRDGGVAAVWPGTPTAKSAA